MRIAIIDIGSNSFILLIAEIQNHNYKVINQYFEIPRLGANLMIDGTISEESINNAVNALKKFKQIIEENQVDIVLPVATAVLREAKNRDKVRQLLSGVIGQEIQVISGEEEAKFSFLGSINSNENCLVIDVGGGSTEIVYGNLESIKFVKSFPIGAAKVKSKFFEKNINSHSISDAKEFLKSIFYSDYNFPNDVLLIGVGGTITTLAYILNNLSFYDSAVIQNTIISYPQNQNLFAELIKLTPSELSERYNIHPKRADILTSGQLIYLTLQEQFNKADIKVSTQGLRFGILKNYMQKIS